MELQYRLMGKSENKYRKTLAEIKYIIEEKGLKNKRRYPKLVAYRQKIACILSEHYNLKLKEVANLVGYKEHSNVLHAIKTVNNTTEKNNPLYFQYYTEISDLLL